MTPAARTTIAFVLRHSLAKAVPVAKLQLRLGVSLLGVLVQLLYVLSFGEFLRVGLARILDGSGLDGSGLTPGWQG